jgi:hypothetical protein
MSRNTFKCGALVIALALPLGGCLEPLFFPPYNHGHGYKYPGLCRETGGPGGDWRSYRCQEKYPAPAIK